MSKVKDRIHQQLLGLVGTSLDNMGRKTKYTSADIYQQLVFSNPPFYRERYSYKYKGELMITSLSEIKVSSLKDQIMRYIREIQSMSCSTKHRMIIAKSNITHLNRHITHLLEFYQRIMIVLNKNEGIRIYLVDEIGDNISKKKVPKKILGALVTEYFDSMEEIHHNVSLIRSFKSNDEMRAYMANNLKEGDEILTDFANEFFWIAEYLYGVQLTGAFMNPWKECAVKTFYRKTNNKVKYEDVPKLSPEFLLPLIRKEIKNTLKKLKSLRKSLRDLKQKVKA